MTIQNASSKSKILLLLCSWAVLFEIVVFAYLLFVFPTYAEQYAELGLALPALTRVSLQVSDWSVLNTSISMFVVLPGVLVVTLSLIRTLFRKEQKGICWLIAIIPTAIFVALCVAAYLPFSSQVSVI